MENLFAIGATIQLNWTLNSIAGEAFSLSGHTYQLHISCGNENAIATGVTHSGNVLTWTFRPSAAWKRGAYTLWLDVYANGTKIVTVTYPNAFHIVSRTASDVQSVAVQTGSATLNLVSSLDFYRFAPVVPVVGEDGYWYVNGQKVIDENEEYVLSSHTVEYDPTTKNIIIDKDRVDSEGNSIQQTVTAIPDALSAMQSSYDAAEGSSDESTAGDGSRWGSYKTAEAARDADAAAAEGTSSSNAGDGTRWGAYKTAEAARNTARETAEGSSSSEAGDGSRWGAYKTAEAARDSAFETSTGNVIQAATEAAQAANGAASDANTAASRANTAAAAAEQVVITGQGPAGKSAYQIWLDAGNTGDEEDFLDSLDGRSAYQVWLDAGNTGSVSDFLEYLGGQPGADGVGFHSISTQQDGTVVITLSDGNTITLDLNHNHPNYVSKLIETTNPSGGFLPDVVYKLGEITGNVTFALAAAVNGNTNHYFWSFTAGSTPPTITWPSGMAWADGEGPTIVASGYYEISVLDGIAAYLEV